MPYNSSKVALVNFSEALALEVRPQNIGVTCLCPGPVRNTNILEQYTFLTKDLPMMPPELSFMEPEEVGRQLVDALRNGTFFLPTHPEVHAIYAEHGANPDRFLEKAVARLAEREQQSQGLMAPARGKSDRALLGQRLNGGSTRR
jgi:short-subunit dehydrogenase